MANDRTLHVKIDSETELKLKRLSEIRRKSRGQLVRDAISACYQTAFAGLPLRQGRALAAYQGGFISLGKLAREMGMHVLQVRSWLEEHDIPQRNVYGDEDADRA